MIGTMLFPDLKKDVDEIFNEFFEISKKEIGKYPLTDVYVDKTDGATYIEIALAGFNKDDIEVFIENDELVIRGKHKQKDEIEKNRIYLQKDIAKRAFERKYKLVTNIDKIEAKFENGILKIKLVPVKKEDLVQKIEIK
jgi:HSP20 family molecular chaperone IbpA